MSTARRSKKWPGPARPSRPCSMSRKNGSSAAKSARLAMGAFTMPRLLPRRSDLAGEVRSSGAARLGHVAGRPGNVGVEQREAHVGNVDDADQASVADDRQVAEMTARHDLGRVPD